MKATSNEYRIVQASPPPQPPRAPGSRSEGNGDLWARACATAGGAAWAAIAVLTRMGIARLGEIELLFLFAPLVVVPLTMELGREIGGGGILLKTAQRLQPLGAGLAVWAMWIGPGRKAGVIAAGWLVVCLCMAGVGLTDLYSVLKDEGIAGSTFVSWAFVLAIARIDLAVGGAWLVASRLGMRPMGIQEPIGLLTAVHFHFAGFATATIAATALKFRQLHFPQLQFPSGQRKNLWLGRLVLAIAVLPYLVAAGFVISPVLKMSAAILFSASVAVLAVYLRSCAKQLVDAAARLLLHIAAGAIFAGMIFSGAYAVANFLGSDALTIPQMARTHGVLNATGFCLCGLLAWLAEAKNKSVQDDALRCLSLR